ncbi:MAG: ABC transporter ATP-binding protein, partial [Lachnospiraceae bacterium]|nr:ABC transporter ATP-binding protein [Lachnospiraceae bacterium]
MRNRHIIKKVLHYISRYWGLLILSLVMAAVSALLALVLPILTGDAIDMIVAKGQVDFDGLSKIINRMLTVIGVTIVAQYIM